MVQTPEQVRPGISGVDVGEATIAQSGIPEARLLPTPTPAPPAPKKRSRWIYAIAGGIVIAIIAAIAIFALTRDDSGGTDRVTGGTAAEQVEGLQITTASGTFTISDVIVGDRYPEGCADTDPSCNIAMAGYEVVVVELTPQGSADVEELMDEGSGAYITSADGSRTESFLYGWSTTEDDSKEGMVGFTPEASDQGFTLHWPGNDPVALGK